MNPKDRLIEMFDQMVLRKDASLIERYYHPDFLLYTNGQEQAYDAFADGHRRVYANEISYDISYDDDAWVVTDDRVAGRVWITTSRPDEEPTTIEVVLNYALIPEPEAELKAKYLATLANDQERAAAKQVIEEYIQPRMLTYRTKSL